MAFSQQMQNFESWKMNFTNREYLGYAVSKIAPKHRILFLKLQQELAPADVRPQGMQKALSALI